MTEVDPTLALAGDLLLFAGFPAIILFTIFYGTRSKWRVVLAGRSMFYMSAALSAVILLVAYSRAATQFGWPFPYRGQIRLIVYLVISFAMWRQFFTLLRYQKKERKDEVSPVEAKNMDDPEAIWSEEDSEVS